MLRRPIPPECVALSRVLELVDSGLGIGSEEKRVLEKTRYKCYFCRRVTSLASLPREQFGAKQACLVGTSGRCFM